MFRRKIKEISVDVVRVSKTLPRPTEDDIKKISDNVNKLKSGKSNLPKIDRLFLQDISDRLYGPDSESYIEELRKLNSKFRPRVGKNCIDFYEPGIVIETKNREREINQRISKETI